MIVEGKTQEDPPADPLATFQAGGRERKKGQKAEASCACDSLLRRSGSPRTLPACLPVSHWPDPMCHGNFYLSGGLEFVTGYVSALDKTRVLLGRGQEGYWENTGHCLFSRVFFAPGIHHLLRTVGALVESTRV